MADTGKRYGKDNNDGFNERYEREEKERIMQAKKRRNRRIRSRRFITFLFTVLLILCIMFVFIKTPLFNVDRIEIKGNTLVSDEEIFTAIKISEGENIFTHSIKYMEKNLVSLPYISQVEIQKKYPSEIHIKITEEDEFAILDFPGKRISCDKNGKSVRVVTDSPKEELIIIKGCQEGKFDLGEYVVLSDPGKTDILKKCLAAVTDYGFSDVVSIDLSETDDIVFDIRGNLIIKMGELGDDDELSYKMAYIKEVMNNLPQNISGIIDATNIESGVSYRTGEFELENSETEEAEEISEEKATETEAEGESEEEIAE